MKKILVLGWYWNVGQVVVHDLINSNFIVWIAWRNEEKIDAIIKKMLWKKSSWVVKKVLIDLTDEKSLIEIFKKYDLVVNCLEYTFNQLILDLCIEAWKNYVDMWDDYKWIKLSRTKDWLVKESWIIACLWAGSAPWIVNVLIKYAVKNMEKVETLTISFSDIIKNAPEKMLPFNFQTVVEEITWDALLFENWKYKFVEWSSKKINANFCWLNKEKNCFLPWSFVTNHDEQYSLPEYLNNKWLKNLYFVMKHSDNVIKLVESLNEFWFLNKDKISIEWIETSPYDFCNTIMAQYAPQNFKVEDKESLFIKLDEKIVEIVNYSVDGVPAWIVNTWIWASLIAQYLANNEQTPWVYHPEYFVDDVWFIEELKKRNFEIYVDNKKI